MRTDSSVYYFILFYVSSSDGYEWLGETYLLHFDVIISMDFFPSE